MLGLCICYSNHNYGTMLQAYATTVFVEKLGMEYEIIRYRKKITPWFALKSLPRLLNPILLHEKKLLLQKKMHLKHNSVFARGHQQKEKAFVQFEQSYFHNFSPVYYGYGALCANATRYGGCLVGSDQLWSPAGLPTNFYNLKFVPAAIPKISYAASFGVSSIPFFQKRRTRDFLLRIEHLSVRENSAQDIVKTLTGREAKVVVDPTMLLTSEDWASYIPLKNPQPQPYLFAYFLGANAEYRVNVTHLANQMGLKLIALHHMDEFVAADECFGDEAPFDVGPAEFLNLIRHAEYVCTDSFHGTVFSVLHHKKFVVFNRFAESANSRNSRIVGLCENLGLSHRRFDTAQSLLEQIQEPIAYEIVEQKIQKFRAQSVDFFTQSLLAIPSKIAL